jgi:hypothetical protein
MINVPQLASKGQYECAQAAIDVAQDAVLEGDVRNLLNLVHDAVRVAR